MDILANWTTVVAEHYVISGVAAASVFVIVLIVWIVKLKRTIARKTTQAADGRNIKIDQLSKEIKRMQGCIDELEKMKRDNYDKGRYYEISVGRHYDKNGYKVEFNGFLKRKADKGVDIIASKGDRTVLIQCKCWKRGLDHEKVKAYSGNMSQYVRDKNLSEDKVDFVLAIPKEEALDKSAKNYFEFDMPKLKFEIIPMDDEFYFVRYLV